MYLKEGARCRGLDYRLITVMEKVGQLFLLFLCLSFVCAYVKSYRLLGAKTSFIRPVTFPSYRTTSVELYIGHE